MEFPDIHSSPEFDMEDFDFIRALNSLDQPSAESVTTNSFGESLNNSYSDTMFETKPSIKTSYVSSDRPAKILKTTSSSTWYSPKPNPQSSYSSFSTQLSFSTSNHANHQTDNNYKPKPVSENMISFPSESLASHCSFDSQTYMLKGSEGGKRVSTTTKLTGNDDHVLAERKRREKLSQQFVALSATIPGLKKMDKATILGEATKLMKQLQERVKKLEDQMKKKSMESVVFVRRFELPTDSGNSSSDENSLDSSYSDSLPEIEARFSDSDVLIRIHCEKKKGITDKVVTEVEKFNLTVANSSVMSFGSSALDITVIAQMDREFNMGVKDLARNLRAALKQFM